METITLTWWQQRNNGVVGDNQGRTVPWEEPLGARTDSWAVAAAWAAEHGVAIDAVDHDGACIHVTLGGLNNEPSYTNSG